MRPIPIFDRRHALWSPWVWAFVLVVFAVGTLLSGCQTTDGTPSLKAICDATLGPISYNSTVLKSRRHAGPDLVLDLKEHNQVGRSLGCPNY
jgi:hypothetical protein